MFYEEEEFEDTKGVIRIRKLKDRQHNGQKKNDKRTNIDLHVHLALHRKLKIKPHELHIKLGVNSITPEGLAVPVDLFHYDTRAILRWNLHISPLVGKFKKTVAVL